MDIPFISFLITCKNEGHQLKTLIDVLLKHINNNEIIILNDFSSDEITCDLLDIYRNLSSTVNINVYEHSLNNDYGAHKNYGKSLCKGKYIFQIDADELPSEYLLASLNDLILLNEDIDLFWIPRINDFDGVTDIESKKWGWGLTKFPELIREKIIDDQSYEYEFLKKNGYILEETKIQ